MSIVITNHAQQRADKRLANIGVKLNKKQLRRYIKNIVKFGNEIKTNRIGERHYQCVKHGLIVVVLRSYIVKTCMFPHETYRYCDQLKGGVSFA